MIINRLKQLQAAIHRIESGMLIVLLLSMIIIAVVQIVLRNVFGTGLLWGESLVRISVLWTALLGAMIAARYDQHIKIDLVTRYLNQKNRARLNLFIGLVTATICSVVGYYSTLFVLLEYEDGGLAFGQVPSWLCESIMPVAFFVLAFRFLANALLSYFHTGKESHS